MLEYIRPEQWFLRRILLIYYLNNVITSADISLIIVSCLPVSGCVTNKGYSIVLYIQSFHSVRCIVSDFILVAEWNATYNSVLKKGMKKSEKYLLPFPVCRNDINLNWRRFGRHIYLVLFCPLLPQPCELSLSEIDTKYHLQLYTLQL